LINFRISNTIDNLHLFAIDNLMEESAALMSVGLISQSSIYIFGTDLKTNRYNFRN